MEQYNHIKFAWDNSYDVYSAAALNKAMRPDIIGSAEDDGYHFRSKSDLQPMLDVMVDYQMDFTILELLPGFELHAVK